MSEKSLLRVWILSVLTFLAILADFGLVSYWVLEGPSFVLRPYLIGDLINAYIDGGSVYGYLCISLTATSIFLGLTFFANSTPTNMTMAKMLSEVQVSQGKTQEALREKIQALDQQFSAIEEKIAMDQRKDTPKSLKKIRTELEDAKREMLNLISQQNEKAQRNIESLVKRNLTRIRKEMLSELAKHGKRTTKFEGRDITRKRSS